MYKGGQISLNAAFSVLLVILLLSYPFVVYQHIEEVRPRWFAGLLLVVIALRFIFVANLKRNSDWLMLCLVSAFCLSVMLFDSQQLLKLYPVLMNVGMGGIFLVSLKDKQCLIEYFANARSKPPPPEARDYLRKLNLVWGGVLILNGVASAYTALFASLSVWALYNGILSYVLIASLVAAEWVYRGHYKKKHNIVDD